MKSRNYKTLLTLGVILLPLIGAFIVGKRIVDTSESMDIRKKAAEPESVSGGVAALRFNPQQKTVYAGDNVSVAVQFKAPPTLTNNKGITGMKAVFFFNNSGIINLADKDLTESLSSPWSYQRKEVTTVGNLTTVTVEALYVQAGTDGYHGADNNFQDFVTFNLTVPINISSSLTTTLSFDISRSEIRSKFNNEDILSSDLASANYTFSIDTIAPETTIISGPSGVLTSLPASFVFSGQDTPEPPVGTSTTDLRYQWRLSDAAWSAFSSQTSVSLSQLSPGQHTFEVRAADLKGNVDSTPASRTFTYSPQTKLNMVVRFQGLHGSGFKNYDKPLKIFINKTGYNSGDVIAVAKFDQQTGYYKIPITLPSNFPLGMSNYDVYVKSDSHLRKKFSGISITGGAQNNITKTSASDVIIRGDVTGDNKITIEDLTQLISYWIASETPVNQSTQKYDLTEDGFVAISDFTAILENWTRSEVLGD